MCYRHDPPVGAKPSASVELRKAFSTAADALGFPFDAIDSALFDALPVAVYVCDRDARIVGFNRRAVALWGREPGPDDRFCGSFRMIRHDGSVLAHAECPMANVLKTGEAVRDAGVIVERQDGSRVSVQVTIVPLTDTAGQVAGAVNTFQDIEELKRADAAATRRERELHDFVENATEGLHWAGPDGLILWANRAELDLLGYSRDEYVGHHVAQFHADRPVIDDILARLWRNERVHEYEARMRCRDGSVKHVLIDSSVLWRDGQFIHTRSFTRDITDRKRVEEARRQSEEQLAVELIERTQAEMAARAAEAQLRRATQLLEEAVHAREDFLSTAAHELRNPVNALQLQLVALLRATQDNGEAVSRAWASDRIGQAVTAVRRLVKLVEALLDVSRITAGRLDLEPEPMDFGQAVDAVVSRFADQLKERQIVSHVPRTPGSWDRLRVEQIVTNLLSNAIKFGEGLPIEISVESDEATVCLTVTDHGIGIDCEHQQQLFERFERAVSHRHYGGFGLGLWITQQIVDAMGGRMAIESRPAEGSTFRVTLPLHSAALTAADQEGLPR